MVGVGLSVGIFGKAEWNFGALERECSALWVYVISAGMAGWWEGVGLGF